ncbi:hypothetical protein [Pseudoxanthomonas sp. CF125]|uniref:hypothetical protein n=1 Tax=Pseudoxanthomonas sp. CF125 TaxID=1855303 RepID=UPI000887C396|nr:hypothetical protein [Pseudoxanthomonas sp. CF125]SDQ43156.1 hypothetical protein SAMN05216569_1100 [Pseudoxanthomonas sp. CF125]
MKPRTAPFPLIDPQDVARILVADYGLDVIAMNNESIEEFNQERLDHEAANPQTRTNYKGNF